MRYTEEAVKATKKIMSVDSSELPPMKISIKLGKGDDYLSWASAGGFKWLSDEPPQRGGHGEGPTPLSYFLSGLGFCQLVHYTEHIIMDGLDIHSIEMSVVGTITKHRPRRFTEVTYEVRLTGHADAGGVKELARKAADDCYVTNTLKNACKVSGIIIYNGKEIDRH